MRARARWMLVVGIVVGMVLGGGVAYAGHQFSDVPNSNPFHKEIDFIADRKITLGCGGGKYCPKDFVTREQMAAFMERVVRVGTPVVLAETEGMSAGSNQKLCVTNSYVPDYPQQVVFSGGVFAGPDSDATGDLLTASVIYRTNGGSWKGVDNTVTMQDGNGPSSFSPMAVALVGTLWLAPGSSYEFGARVGSEGDVGVCQLTAVISNRMPTSIGLP